MPPNHGRERINPADSIKGENMIRSYLDPTKLSIIECLFEKIGSGAKIKDIQASLPRNSKYPTKHLSELEDLGIVVCDDKKKPENERVYSGNGKSMIFTSLFNIDIKLNKIELERKNKLRQLLSSKKEG